MRKSQTARHQKVLLPTVAVWRRGGHQRPALVELLRGAVLGHKENKVKGASDRRWSR